MELRPLSAIAQITTIRRILFLFFSCSFFLLLFCALSQADLTVGTVYVQYLVNIEIERLLPLAPPSLARLTDTKMASPQSE